MVIWVVPSLLVMVCELSMRGDGQRTHHLQVWQDNPNSTQGSEKIRQEEAQGLVS